MAIYKRFMVFTWTTYENTEPFFCVHDSFDDKNEAINTANSIGKYEEDGEKLFCVFDRVDGVFIDT